MRSQELCDFFFRSYVIYALPIIFASTKMLRLTKFVTFHDVRRCIVALVKCLTEILFAFSMKFHRIPNGIISVDMVHILPASNSDIELNRSNGRASTMQHSVLYAIIWNTRSEQSEKIIWIAGNLRLRSNGKWKWRKEVLNNWKQLEWNG